MSAPRELSDAALAVVERALRDACGFSLAPAVRRSLPGRVAEAAHAMGRTAAELVEAVERGDAACVEALVEASVVAETYFFRQPEHFEELSAIARATPAGAPLAIWSAACATGEEAYSAAIVLLEAGRAEGTTVLATDVSRRCLAAARAGRYGPWSLRRVDAAARARWFVPGGDGFLEIAPAARRLVRFAEHNLTTQPPAAAGFDVVLCRNVLIYFEPAIAAEVIARLRGALRPGGLLFLASAEVPLATCAGLEPVPGAAGALRRVERAAPRATPAPRGTPVPVARPRPTPVPGHGPAAVPSPVAAPPPMPPPPVPTPLPVSAEAFLSLAIAAEARGDADAALAALRRALYLDPRLPGAHAHAVRLFERLGRAADAERSRSNALAALGALDDGAPVAGFDDVTAGALRRALQRTA